jgi:hypothetical protein
MRRQILGLVGTKHLEPPIPGSSARCEALFETYLCQAKWAQRFGADVAPPSGNRKRRLIY